MNGFIYVSNDIDKAYTEIEESYSNISLFEAEEIKTEDIFKIKSEAYIATEKEKEIVIKTRHINAYAQNALLKLLEEPPERVFFVLLVSSKYALFDTVKSRLVLEEKNYETAMPVIDFDVNALTNETIFSFLQGVDYDKNGLKEVIYALFNQSKELTSFHLDIFERALRLVELNADKKAVLSLILLALKNK